MWVVEWAFAHAPAAGLTASCWTLVNTARLLVSARRREKLESEAITIVIASPTGEFEVPYKPLRKTLSRAELMGILGMSSRHGMTLTGLDDWIDWLEQEGFRASSEPVLVPGPVETEGFVGILDCLGIFRREKWLTAIFGDEGVPRMIVLRHDDREPKYHSIAYCDIGDAIADIAEMDSDLTLWDRKFC